MRSARAVVVNGPRQEGKTALLRMLQERRGGSYVSLDRPSDLTSALADPTGFVMALDVPAHLDEVQRGGDPLLLAIKHEVDRSDERGRLLLVGSTRFLTEPRISESLAGRVRIIDPWPLSQGEIDSAGDGFIDAAFGGRDALLAIKVENAGSSSRITWGPLRHGTCASLPISSAWRRFATWFDCSPLGPQRKSTSPHSVVKWGSRLRGSDPAALPAAPRNDLSPSPRPGVVGQPHIGLFGYSGG